MFYVSTFKFQNIIRICCLSNDLNDRKKFRNGANQIVSENGSDLSGGQKCRIHLARALYYDAQIYLFDNPLSAYDKNPEKTEKPSSKNTYKIERGEIEFRKVKLAYNDEETVLEDLSFIIAPGQRVGLIGRTGSGKTTILMTLLRLINHSGGEILIDGKKISEFNLNSLRKQITVITQEPVIFSDTVRFNLDPEDLIRDDDKLYNALETVGLIQIFENSNGTTSLPREQKIRQILDYQIRNEGTELSFGQKQLFCLARALLKESQIYLIDEATSNLDEENERRIQDIINEKLRGKTILTIAHHLNTIKDYDKIMGLKNGQLLDRDFKSPKELLDDKESVLYDLFKDLSEDDQNKFLN